MSAQVFILPTAGARTYRGAYPFRARHVSSGATGYHIELLNGTRLWSMAPIADDSGTYGKLTRANFADAFIVARLMTAEQYAELTRAAEMLRGMIGIAGHGRRERLARDVRAICLAIAPVDPAPALAPDVVADADASGALVVLEYAQRGPISFPNDASALRAWIDNRADCGDPQFWTRPSADMPFTLSALPPIEIAETWAAPAPVDPAPALAIVTGRDIDGAQYLTAHGFEDNRGAALVMSMADAIEIAAREEREAAETRGPESGIYQIKAVPYSGPALYTLADYDRDAQEAAALDSFYGAPPVDPMAALGALATVANETAHCVPDGMAKDELSAAIVAAFAVLNGGRA